MSKVKIAPQRVIFYVVAFAFVVYSVVTIISQASQIKTNKEIINTQNEQLAYEQKRSQELDEETAKIGTDEFIEKQAKEKLGYVKSNEKIFYDKAQ